MINLNLQTNTKEQDLIKQYLEENVSEILASKINNGTPIIKDEKELVNKKNLDGFFSYANGEAKKLAEKGATCACINHDTVFGWAIHYFEEDSIEGSLFNLDGTEFKATVVPIQPRQPAPILKKVDNQHNLFDLMQPIEESVETTIVEDEVELEMLQEFIDKETGEILESNYEEINDIDNNVLKKLKDMFGNDIEVIL